jgi:Ca2+-binding EF-hand superfamily protein
LLARRKLGRFWWLCLECDKSGQIKSIDAAVTLFYRVAPCFVSWEIPVHLRFAIRLALYAGAMSAMLGVPAAAWAQAKSSQPGTSANAQPITKAALAAQLDNNFVELDTNKDKSLSKAEIEAAQNRNLATARAELDKRIAAEFAKLDSDKNGQVTMAEFKAFIPGPKIQPAADLLKQLDRNSDGKVGQDEFRSVPLANFDRVDLNKDGTISADERAAAPRRQ